MLQRNHIRSWSSSLHRALAISLCPISNPRWHSLGTLTQDPSLESSFGQCHVDVLRPFYLHQQEAKPLGAGQNPQGRRCSHGPIMPPLHPVAIRDTQFRKKSLHKCLRAARTSNPDELPSGCADRACHHLAPNANPFCVCRSFSKDLAHVSSRRGPLETHHRNGPALPKEILPLTVGQTLQIWRNVQVP